MLFCCRRQVGSRKTCVSKLGFATQKFFVQRYRRAQGEIIDLLELPDDRARLFGWQGTHKGVGRPLSGP
jgi:hypothetical protein